MERTAHNGDIISKELNGLESHILTAHPVDFVFQKRIQRELSRGFFNELFDEDVSIVKIVSVGDRHYEMGVTDCQYVYFDGQNSNINGVAQVNLNYPCWQSGTVQFGKRQVKFPIFDEEIILASLDQVRNYKIDRVGKKIIMERILEGNLVTDSTKQIILEGKSGKSHSVIYKSFPAIRLEEKIYSFMRKEGFSLPPIRSRTDEFGNYGLIDFVENSSQLTPLSVSKWNSQQLRLFSTHQVLSYLLGSYDLHHENLLEVSKPDHSPSLVRIDYEDAFSDSCHSFGEFVNWQHLAFPVNDKCFYSIHSMDSYWREFGDAIQHLQKGNLLERMDGFVDDLAKNKALCRRKILRGTALGGVEDGHDQEIVPYYSENLGDGHFESYFQRRQSFANFPIEFIEGTKRSCYSLRNLLKQDIVLPTS